MNQNGKRNSSVAHEERKRRERSMSEVHELRVSILCGLAQRIVPGGGEVSDNDGCFQWTPAKRHKNEFVFCHMENFLSSVDEK